MTAVAVAHLAGNRRADHHSSHASVSLDDARKRTEAWRTDYNLVRPHSSLGQLAPVRNEHRELAIPPTCPNRLQT